MIGSGELLTPDYATTIQNLLNDGAEIGTGGLISIPSSYLIPGAYTIFLQLTNFLGQTSTSQVQFSVVPTILPQVRIAGPRTVQMLRWQKPSLQAVVQLSPAAALLGLALTYDWKVYLVSTDYNASVTATATTSSLDQMLVPVPIYSTSLDPRYFKPPPYVFEPSESYVVEVVVGFADYPDSNSSASALLSIGESGIFASISGGDTQTLSSADNIVVDASGCYDMDFPDTMTLNYTWSCVTVAPLFGAPCLTQLAKVSDSILNISSGDLPQGVYVISVYISSPSGQMTSTNTTLNIVQGRIPTVAIQQKKAKYNPDSKIILGGAIGAIHASAVALWTTTDNSTSAIEALESVALTPTIGQFPKGQTPFQLAIAPNVLLGGQSYTFRLVGAYMIPGGSVEGYSYRRLQANSGTSSVPVQAFAEVTLYINSPPVGGKLGEGGICHLDHLTHFYVVFLSSG